MGATRLESQVLLFLNICGGRAFIPLLPFFFLWTSTRIRWKNSCPTMKLKVMIPVEPDFRPSFCILTRWRNGPARCWPSFSKRAEVLNSSIIGRLGLGGICRRFLSSRRQAVLVWQIAGRH